MTYIPEALRRQVYERANGKCEYCLLPERYAVKRHEADHIRAEKHGGLTTFDNLCLSCFDCNRFKGSDLSSIDPLTDDVVALYHPRRQVWTDHFRFEGAIIDPLTPAGRVTVRLFHINDQVRVTIRQMLIELGRYGHSE